MIEKESISNAKRWNKLNKFIKPNKKIRNSKDCQIFIIFIKSKIQKSLIFEINL